MIHLDEVCNNRLSHTFLSTWKLIYSLLTYCIYKTSDCFNCSLPQRLEIFIWYNTIGRILSTVFKVIAYCPIWFFIVSHLVVYIKLGHINTICLLYIIGIRKIIIVKKKFLWNSCYQFLVYPRSFMSKYF